MTFSLFLFVFLSSTERATFEAAGGSAELFLRSPVAAVAWRDGGERAK